MESQDDASQSADQGSTSATPPPACAPPAVSEQATFLDRVDWLTFGLTTVLTFAVYLWTLSPEVDLEMSGILSTAAAYGGVAHPPGFPIWTLYAWLFTKLLPFSNIAWRISVSSAVVGALSCGMIALIVSRGGTLIMDGMPAFRRLDPKDERLLRWIAGAVAGMVFGFDGAYWITAVTTDTLTLTLALFSVALCLFQRWSYSLERRRYLYGAFFLFGLTLCANPVLMPDALGLPFFVMFAEAAIGRELFFAASVLAFAIAFSSRSGLGHGSQVVYLWIGILSGAMWLALVFKTRRLFTKCWPAIAAGLFALLGVAPYFYLPIASMTNPPSNWGYARTVEGFVHLITRGQFEALNPTGDPFRLIRQLGMYFHITTSELGWFPSLAALVPFCLILRMRGTERRLLLGFAAFFVCASLFMTILLNPPPDRQALGMVERYFTPSHLLLAIWAGFGLILLGTIIGRTKAGPDHQPPATDHRPPTTDQHENRRHLRHAQLS